MLLFSILRCPGVLGPFLKIQISNTFHLSNGFNYAFDACQSIATQLAQTNPVDFKDKESGDNAEMRHGKGGKSHRQDSEKDQVEKVAKVVNSTAGG